MSKQINEKQKKTRTLTGIQIDKNIVLGGNYSMKLTKAISAVIIVLMILFLFPSSAFFADPPVPTMTLAEDTGIVDDAITNNGQINVNGLEPGATWDYSINSGTSWNTGTGTSFVLADGTYSAGMIQVRQTVSGSASVPGMNADTIVIARNQIYNGDFQMGHVGFTTSYTYSTVPNISEAKCAVVTKADDVHTISVEIDIQSLPEGTEAVQLPDGEVIRIEDVGNGKLPLQISEDDLNQNRALEIVTLDDTDNPSRVYNVQVLGSSTILHRRIAAWVWILISIGIVGFILFFFIIIFKIRKKEDDREQ